MEIMTEKTCSTCINNDGNICDRKGIVAKDDSSCDKHTAYEENWRDVMLRQFMRGLWQGGEIIGSETNVYNENR